MFQDTVFKLYYRHWWESPSYFSLRPAGEMHTTWAWRCSPRQDINNYNYIRILSSKKN
jgi:hypothetical protein